MGFRALLIEFIRHFGDVFLSNYVESFGNQPKLAKKYGLFVNLNQIYN